MRRRKLLSLSLAAAGSATSGGLPNAQVEKCERLWAVAVQTGDTTTLTKICAVDLVYAHSTGEVETRAQYLASFMVTDRRYDAVEISRLQVNVLRELAVVNANGRFRGVARGSAFDNRLAWTHVYVLRAGNWVMVAHQSARLQ